MTERWLEHPEYPGYLVSDYGRVFNRNRDRLVKTYQKISGHFEVELANEYAAKAHYIHRLVADLFIMPLDDSIHVKHRDLDKSNNHYTNLYLAANPSYERTPIYYPPPTRGRSVMINETGEVFRNAYELSEHINGTPSAVYACLRGERSHHLGYTFQYLGD